MAQANQERGIVTLTTTDESETFTVQFSLNGMCALEAETGKSAADFFAAMEAAATAGKPPSMRDFRVFIWAGLVEHHPDLTLEDAGRVVTRCGGLDHVAAVVSDAMESAMPKTEGNPPAGNRKARRKAGRT